MPIFISDPMPPINHGELHIPVVLLVDTSSSMAGTPMKELNSGLVEFGRALEADPLAMGRADVSIISFNSDVCVDVPFQPACDYVAPVLRAKGCTSMNQAIEAGLDAIQERKDLYASQGIQWYRPWMFLLSDGSPTDSSREAAAKSRLQEAILKKKVTFLPMAIGSGANKEHLKSYYPSEFDAKLLLSAKADHFREAFTWLSNSIGIIANSNPAQNNTIVLPTPSTSDGITIELV